MRCHMDLQRLDQEHKDLATRYKKTLEQLKIMQTRVDTSDPLYAPQTAGRDEAGVYRQLLEVERESGRQAVERLAKLETHRAALEEKLAATRASLSVATSQVSSVSSHVNLSYSCVSVHRSIPRFHTPLEGLVLTHFISFRWPARTRKSRSYEPSWPPG